MKNYERRIIIFRLIAVFLLLFVVAAIGFSCYKMFVIMPEGIVLDSIALFSCGLFCIFQIVLIILGKKKDIALQKIAYDENEHINVFPLVMVSIGMAFAITIDTIGLIIYFTRDDLTTQMNILIIFNIGFYLFINCLIYYIFMIMFRKRKFNLEDLIK